MALKARTALALAVTAVLAACATPPPRQQWEARTDADLSADLAACEKESRSVSHSSQQGYSDSRYGAVAAMAGRMDQEDLTGKTLERMHDAILYACMTGKGWKAK